MTFSVYIRLIIESYQHILVSSASEISDFNDTLENHQDSFIIACSVFLVCIIFFVISVVHYFVILKNAGLEHNGYFGEIYSGLKSSKTQRLYTTMFMFRRLALVSLLIFCQSLPAVVLLFSAAIFQVFYLISLVVIRPFDDKTSNVVDIINE
jgi:hypothetical protein